MGGGIGSDARGRATTRRGWPVMAIAGSLLAGAVVLQLSGWAGPISAQPRATGNIAGMGMLTGSVTAGGPFKAAQVYIRNVDKRILYMVSTNAGQFRAVSLFPGNYEVNVVAKGFESDLQKLTVQAGDNPALKIAMKTVTIGADQGAPDVAQNLEGTTVNRISVILDSYENIYPPGRGREIAESTCMTCHGENFLSSQPANEAMWN